jgi:hypothetical protein
MSETTRAEEEPSPEPGGASLCRKKSTPRSGVVRVEPPDDGLDEVELAVVSEGVLGRVLRDHVIVERGDGGPPLGRESQRAVGVFLDARAQDDTALLGEIGLDVRAAPGEADA